MKPPNAVKKVIALILFASTLAVHAEILQEVFPLDSLKTVQQRYPNAVFTKVKAAWVTENDAFFNMQGQGFPGTLYLAFSDSRPQLRKDYQENCSDTTFGDKLLMTCSIFQDH